MTTVVPLAIWVNFYTLRYTRADAHLCLLSPHRCANARPYGTHSEARVAGIYWFSKDMPHRSWPYINDSNGGKEGSVQSN